MVLEMAANVILPENGVVWQQLREGDITGIDFGENSQMLADFITPMLNKNPQLRPTAADLLKHPKFSML
jgi:serine/threonine protein kinase